MYVATVIPIARGIPFDTLSYFAQELLHPGTLVDVPFGKNLLAGIVTESIPLIDAKTSIKGASFSLKKIRTVHGTFPYLSAVAQALATTGTQTLAPIGAVAGHVIPQHLFEYINKNKISSHIVQTTPSEDVCVGTTNERADTYKRIIRTSFAAKQSVLFVAPTIRALVAWKARLEKGLARHTVILHSKTTKKDLRSYFALLKSTEQPLLIFATPLYSVLMRTDIGTLIIEEESSSLYKTNDRFGIDLRIYFQALAHAESYALYWGDTLPRFETLARLGKTHLPRTYTPEKLHIVPIEHYRSVLPREVEELILHAKVKGKRLFIYTNKKGIAPLSRCADCSTIVSCPTCTLPMILRNTIHSDARVRTFICSHCGDTLPATHTCEYCGGWNITPVAIGTESIRDAVKTLVDSEAIYTIDDESTPDSQTIEHLIKEYNQKKFAILIGTVKAIPYLKGVEYSIIPFVDRILSTPSLYTIEHVLRTLYECNEHTTNAVIVCTKHPERAPLTQLATHKINAVIEEELATRESLGYPPYGALIKISLTVQEGYKEKIREAVAQYLADKDTSMLAPRRIELGSMKVLMTWIIKTDIAFIEREGTQLATFLTTLRVPYRIEQNPERF